MGNWFQYIFLKKSFIVAMVVFSAWSEAAKKSSSIEGSVNNEFFEFGVSFGVLNIEDFGGEPMVGIQSTFHATEDFFIEYGYQVSDVSLTSFEQSQDPFFDGSGERRFSHYDLKLGYTLFHGETLLGWHDMPRFSSLYVVAGVGEVQFGGESSLAYTLGLGYKLAVTRNIVARVDFKDYIYQSSLIDDEKRVTHNTYFSMGLSYLF